MSQFCDKYRSVAIIGNVRVYNNEPLDDDAKRMIYKYLEKPNAANWSDISGIHINGRMLTLWQAVRQVDPTFPATGRTYEMETGRVTKEWERIPHPDLVLRAIQHSQNHKSFESESLRDNPEGTNHRNSGPPEPSEQS
jgi:hypothetical protein